MDAPPPYEPSPCRVPREALPAGLRPYVLDVYEETIRAAPGRPLRYPVSAMTTPSLNVILTGGALALIGGGVPLPPLFLGGPQPEAYGIEYHGHVHGFFALFPTVGPLALFGVRGFWRGEPGGPPGLVGRVRPGLEEAARTYTAAIREASDFPARVALTEAFFLDALDGAPPRDLDEAAFLQRAVDEIERTGGAVRAAGLARTLGVSASTLRRRFAVLGMPMKLYAEVVRFRHAHAFLHGSPDASFSDAVAQFGYADQAHLAREYRRFSGGPPTRWVPEARIIDRRMGIEGTYELDEAVERATGGGAVPLPGEGP